jgi:hypothetical protein
MSVGDRILEIVRTLAVCARGLPPEDREAFLAKEHDALVQDARRAGLADGRAQDFADKVAQWIWDAVREDSEPAEGSVSRLPSERAADRADVHKTAPDSEAA